MTNTKRQATTRDHIARQAAAYRARQAWEAANPIHQPQETDQERRDREHAAYLQRRFTTEALEATIAAGGYGAPGGLHPRQADPLLRLDTPERRYRAYSEAHTRQNLRGGILSDNIHDAVNDLLRMIAAGREDEEMYAAAAARRHREAEAEMKALTGRQVILYPPEMRCD